MADVFSKKKRSLVMAAIKGRGGKSTEIALRRMFRSGGVRGWRSNPGSIPGRPDFVFPSLRLAVFTDGCFWHGCRKCGYRDRLKTSSLFWREKLSRNILRDRRVNRSLKADGWRVLRLWEHQIEKSPQVCFDKFRRFYENIERG